MLFNTFVGNGKISLQEFISVMLNKMKAMDTEDEIKNVFKVFDKVRSTAVCSNMIFNLLATLT